jgi:hypothetical protein
MEEIFVKINPSVFLKVELKEPDKIQFVDNLVITPMITEKLLNPYINKLFETLSLRSETPHLGIPRYALNEVFDKLTTTTFSSSRFQV